MNLNNRLERLETALAERKGPRTVRGMSDAELEDEIRRGLGLPDGAELSDELLAAVAEGRAEEYLEEEQKVCL